MKPLTHHEMLTLVAVFARDGQRVDLAASDRAKRIIRFESLEVPAVPGLPAHIQKLSLHNPAPKEFILWRHLCFADGHEATLEVRGREAAQVYEGLEQCDPSMHYRHQSGADVRFSYRLQNRARPGAEVAWQRILVLAQTTIAGREFTLEAGSSLGASSPVLISHHAEGDLDLPDDLLSVLGHAWRPLQRYSSAWKGSLKLPQRQPLRSERAEALFLEGVAHLQAVLEGMHPEGFHRQFFWQRWRVFWWRSLWLQLGLLILLGMALMLWAFDVGEPDQVPMWVNNIPPVLLVLTFLIWSWEVPRFEIPPRPKPLTAAHWQGAMEKTHAG